MTDASQNVPTDRHFEIRVRLWTDMLKEFLGWDEHQVHRWASRFRAGIADENSWFYHETVAFYVAQLLLPAKLHEKTGTAGYYETERWIETFLNDVLEKATTVDGIDWAPAHREIDALLGKYGHSLQDVAAEKRDWYRE